jgi:hypothetical protein
MKEINLHNYEAWFLDFSEGSLNDAEQALLAEFLLQHPELKEELYAFDNDVVVVPDSAKMSHKEGLKVPDEKDFDSLLIALLEGQLTNKEKEKTELLLKSNHTLGTTFNAYQKTILTPDFSIVYPEKENLKKGKGKIIAIYWYGAVAAAACILFFVLNFNINNPIEPQNNFVEIKVDSTLKANPKVEIIMPDATETLAETDKIITPVSKNVKNIKKSVQPKYKEVEKEVNYAQQKNSPQTEVLEGLIMIDKSILADAPISVIKNKVEVIAATPQTVEFLSPKEFLMNKLKAIMRGKDAKNSQDENLSAWEIAETGIAKISNQKLKVERTKDEYGSGFAFISEKFEFSTRSSK